jgi:hypothetical protein
VEPRVLNQHRLGSSPDVAKTAPANGDALLYNTTTKKWTPVSGLSAIGGATSFVQYNDGGIFGGDSGFTWDKTNKLLTLTNTTVASGSGGTVPSLLTLIAASSPTNASTPLRIKALEGGGYFEPVFETPSALRIASTFAGVNSQFRLLPFGNDIYFQNTITSGSAYVGGAGGVDLTGNFQVQSAGAGECLFGATGITGGAKVVAQTSSASKPSIIARAATSQTADIQQWSNVSNTVLCSITKAGDFALKGYVPSNHTDNSYAVLWLGQSNCSFIGEPANGYKCVGMSANRVRSSGTGDWAQQDTGDNSWAMNLGYQTTNGLNGLFLTRSPAGAPTTYQTWFSVSPVGGTLAQSYDVAVAPLTAKAPASPTTNVMECQNSSGTVKAGVTKDFELRTVTGSGAPATTPADGAMYIDTTNHRLYVRSGGAWKYTALI